MKRTRVDSEIGAIGIGAMIVFIALILVAAVASAVIIQTAEKLQQTAQTTGDDTQAEIAGKINVLEAYLTDGVNTHLEWELVFGLAPGSGSIKDTSVSWQTFCLGAGDAFEEDEGTFDVDVITLMDGTAGAGAGALDTLTANNKYRLSVGGTVALAGCEPGVVNTAWADGGNTGKIDMYIHVKGGSTTYLQLDATGTLADGNSIL